MKRFFRSLSAVLAVLLAMTMSFAVLAEDASVSTESVEATESSEVADTSKEETAEESKDAASAEDASTSESKKEESTAESSAAESSTASTQSSTADDSHDHDHDTEEVSDFPWARVITLIVIVVLVVGAIILAKTNTALGQRINKFFKEYYSEVKKVSWFSFRDTMKATGVVLVFILGAALAIGILDWAFTHIVMQLAQIF